MDIFTEKHSPDTSTTTDPTQIVKDKRQTFLLIKRKPAPGTPGSTGLHKIYANYVDTVNTWYAYLPRTPGKNVKDISKEKLEEKISDCETLKFVNSTDEVPQELKDSIEQVREQSGQQSGLDDFRS